MKEPEWPGDNPDLALVQKPRERFPTASRQDCITGAKKTKPEHAETPRRGKLVLGTKSQTESSFFGQRDPNGSLPSLHLLLGLPHLLLAAAVLQEDGRQVAQAGALCQREAQHALQDSRLGDLGTGRGRGKVHEGGDGRQDGLFPPVGQAVCDQADAAALQDDLSTVRVHAEVTQPS